MTSTYASSILRKTLCHASRSKKPQNQTQRADFPKKGNLQKPKPFSFMLILLALLCGRSVAWAQPQGEWNGIATTGEFYVTSDKTINKTVIVGNTDELTLQIKADVTISRDNSKNLLMFHVKPGGTLNIIGQAKPADAGEGYYKATFVGGSTVILDHPTLYQAFEGDSVITVKNKIGIMWNNMGNVTIKHARITGFQVRDGNGNGSRGVINLVSDNPPNNVSKGFMLMEDVEIDHCWGGPAVADGDGEIPKYYYLGRIISLQGGNWDATLKNVELHHCFSCEHPESNTGIHHFGGIIRTEGGITGTLTVDGCRFYNNKYKYWKQGDCKLIGQGGVINWRAGGSGASDTELIIKDSKFYNNQAAEGGAIATNATIKMSNVEINNNKAKYGGGVYFWTYNGGKDEYDGRAFDATFGNGVNIHDNTATQYGGGIYIGIDASDDVGFKAKTSGTWIPANDTASVLFNVEIQTGATIEGNKAPKGAGIAIRDAAPYRHMNTSQFLVNGTTTNPAYEEWSGVYRRKVNIAGGTVCNNTAAQGTTGDEMAGAGIYIEKYEYPAGHTFLQDYNYGNAPGTYGAGTLTVNAESGLIYGNTAINGIKPGFGGGMYIASKFTNNTIVSTLNVNIGKTGKTLEMYGNQAYTDGGGVYVLYDRTSDRKNQGTVTVNGGTIGRKKPVTNEIEGNKALHGNGGGICVKGGTVYVNGGNVEYNTAGLSGGGVYVNVPNNQSTTTIQGGANISNNQAKGGGGVYVDKGKIDIIGSSWSTTAQALVPSETTRINNNTATNNDGGGVYLDEGKINIYGSDINNNEATKGNGGGIYTNSGDIIVWPTAMKDNPNDFLISICEKTKTKVLNNKAGGNGGGLNTHVGRFDVRFAQIKNNTAGYNYSGNGGGNGGGLFCDGTDHDNGYTVRLLHCDLEKNKAHGNVLVGDGITGRGGGVYLKKGSIFAEHCVIIKNEADINGGGLDNHSGELRVYGTYIDENVAHEGRGGGLYTEKGNIVVGPCDTYGYPASKASRIILNKAKINGGGINNHEGDITIHGDIINENEAEEGDGGGVYINSGNIFMYGGQINNNKANKGKGGGVYGGGGQFNIMERKANPIVEILEVENIEATGFKVHYHLVDRGLAPITVAGDAPDYTYSVPNPDNLTHGIAYSSTKDPSTTPWTTASDSTVITYTAGTHEYVLSEGCVRIPVTGLTSASGTKYYIIAWAKYTIGEGPDAVNYYDASPVVEIKAQDPTKQGKAPQGPRSVYPAVDENPFFMELTPLQQAMLANTPEGDTTAAPASRAITDRDDPDPKAPENIPQINGNTARYGGGICIDKQSARLVFSGTKGEVEGQINKNFASEAGGGIYISQSASMQMKYHCQVVENHVPAGKDGGGIYLDGTLLVGDKKGDDPTFHSLKVKENWAGDGVYDEDQRNNVFLPLDPILDGDALHKKRVITLLSDISGKKNGIFVTQIGISVDRGFREVIYSENDEHEGGAVSTKQWLEKLMPESGNVLNKSLFDDKKTYYALHVTPSDDLFDEDYIYFWSCWTTIVNTDPNNDGTGTKHYRKSGTGANEVWHIYTREGLAWFSSLINGLNGVTANPAAKAFVENDLDMSAHLWVPLGSVKKAEGTGTDIIFTDGGQYSGEFDGQGNIISGLICTYMTGIFKYGLFGTLAEGAKVKNTFVDNYKFITYKQKDPDTPGSYITNPAYKMGGIAAEMANATAVISNCEARGQMRAVICNAEKTYVGGIAGDVQQGAIHSCMAMPTITGTAQYMGGLAGNLDAATTLKNSYANVLFSTTPTPAYNVGGIAGVNNGTIENVYVRYRNDDQVSPLTLPDNFYWFVGNNPNQTGGQNSINFCYAPHEQRGKDLAAPKRANNRRGYLPTNLVDNKYGFAHKDQQMVKKSNWNVGTDVNDYADNANGAMVVDSLSGLLRTLNKWVAKNSGYTPWTRTMASPINDDYPVLQIADFNVVGSEDGIYMKYDTCVNRMWKTDGKNFQSLTKENNPKAAMYLYKTNGVTAKNSTPVPINVTGNTAVRLYIHENVGITQTDGAELHARVGVTFDNSNKSLELGGKAYDWHMFSSALTSASMGLKYHTNEEDYPGVDNYYILNNFNNLSTNGIEHDYYVERINMDPPKTTWFKGNVCVDSVGYFPTNTPYGSWRNQLAGENGSFDFYCFHEESRHWINFKREGTDAFMDHWHEDIDGSGKHQNLRYENESTLRVGKGYMMGVSAVSMLMADGILNNGVKSNDEEPTGKLYSAEKLTNSDYGFNPSGYSEELRGTNLVGNPFQSYLNFSALANDNDNKNIIENGAYYLFDADARRYLCYPTDASTNPINAPQFIHPHQGFFVKTANGGYLTFKNSMRSATAGNGSTFRGDNLNYPLVNLFCYDAEGHYDVTTVEMNRPKLGGGLKLKDMRNGNSLIYARLEDEDYQTLFAPTGTSTVPVRFEPSQDGVYTMRWGTLHGDFHYLHLVDNMSGADVDMLRSEEYRFEATTTDYISRFKLVFEVTDVEENPIEAEATTFAFCMGDELIVNGAGYLEVFDVQGRRLSAKRLVDAQSSVSLPNVAAGIYFLRLSDDKQVRTQKMVINY